MLTCTSCRVLQEVQQDEAWAATEAAPRPLPVRNVLQDDVAALLIFLSHVFMKYKKSKFFVPHRQTAFLISQLFGASFFPFFKIFFEFLKGPYF